MIETYAPGELDQRIRIERETMTDDGLGGQSVSLATYDLWAHVRPRSGREQHQADRLDGRAMYLFVIRNRTGVRESDRIVWGGVRYNIRAILSKGPRAKYLEIDAERGVAQ